MERRVGEIGMEGRKEEEEERSEERKVRPEEERSEVKKHREPSLGRSFLPLFLFMVFPFSFFFLFRKERSMCTLGEGMNE